VGAVLDQPVGVEQQRVTGGEETLPVGPVGARQAGTEQRVMAAQLFGLAAVAAE
jgi:hypothetical protein